jgi:gas vesicle protein
LIEAVTHRDRNRRDNTKKVVTAAVVGTVAGIAVGVVAGLLLAPKSGKETREDIKELAKKAAEDLKATGETVVTRMSAAFDSARQSVGKIRDKLQGEHEYPASEGLEPEVAVEIPTGIEAAPAKEPKVTVVTGRKAAEAEAKPAAKRPARPEEN